MNPREYIERLADQKAEEFGVTSKARLLWMQNRSPKDFNSALNQIEENGAIAFFQCLSTVHHLVKLGFPILICEANPNLAVFLPYKPLNNYHIDYRSVPRTLDEYLQRWLEWYNWYANKNIIAEPRFFEHIVYNFFHEEQHLLP